MKTVRRRTATSRSALNLEIKIPRSDEINSKIEESGIDVLSYSKWGRYKLSLEKEGMQSTEPKFADSALACQLKGAAL